MPLKIIQKDHSEIVGKGSVLLSVPPERFQEFYTGQIAEEVALLSKAHAVISRAPKSNTDRNDSTQISSDFEENINKFLEDVRVVCVLALFGMIEPGIEIRTSDGGPQTNEIIRIISQTLGTGLDLRVRPVKLGQSSQGSGIVATVWIGLGPDERGFRKDKVVSKLADVVGLINRQFGGSEGDERAGNVLD